MVEETTLLPEAKRTRLLNKVVVTRNYVETPTKQITPLATPTSPDEDLRGDPGNPPEGANAIAQARTHRAGPGEQPPLPFFN